MNDPLSTRPEDGKPSTVTAVERKGVEGDVNKTQKQEAVQELREMFEKAQGIVVSEFRGLTVAQANALRRGLEKEGAGHKVVKNTLARIAVQGTPYEPLVDEFVGPTAVSFTFGDPVALAKAVVDFAKANPQITIRSGGLPGRAITAAEVEALAKLPSREQLLGQFVGVLAGPIRGLLGVLSGVPRGFVQVLSQIQKQKEAA
ncbi:50S ribosomal protein L10 [Deferrisoma palaeochoriense]